MMSVRASKKLTALTIAAIYTHVNVVCAASLNLPSLPNSLHQLFQALKAQPSEVFVFHDDDWLRRQQAWVDYNRYLPLTREQQVEELESKTKSPERNDASNFKTEINKNLNDIFLDKELPSKVKSDLKGLLQIEMGTLDFKDQVTIFRRKDNHQIETFTIKAQLQEKTVVIRYLGDGTLEVRPLQKNKEDNVVPLPARESGENIELLKSPPAASGEQSKTFILNVDALKAWISGQSSDLKGILKQELTPLIKASLDYLVAKRSDVFSLASTLVLLLGNRPSAQDSAPTTNAQPRIDYFPLGMGLVPGHVEPKDERLNAQPKNRQGEEKPSTFSRDFQKAIDSGAVQRDARTGRCFTIVANTRLDLAVHGDRIIVTHRNGRRVNMDGHNAPLRGVIQTERGPMRVHFGFTLDVTSEGGLIARGYAHVGSSAFIRDGNINDTASGVEGAGRKGFTSQNLLVKVNEDGTIYFKGKGVGQVAFVADVGQLSVGNLGGASFQPVTPGSRNITVAGPQGQLIAHLGSGGHLQAGNNSYTYSAGWTLLGGKNLDASFLQDVVSHFGITPGSAIYNPAGKTVGVVVTNNRGALSQIIISDNDEGRAALNDIYFNNRKNFEPGGIYHDVNILQATPTGATIVHATIKDLSMFGLDWNVKVTNRVSISADAPGKAPQLKDQTIQFEGKGFSGEVIIKNGRPAELHVKAADGADATIESKLNGGSLTLPAGHALNMDLTTGKIDGKSLEGVVVHNPETGMKVRFERDAQNPSVVVPVLLSDIKAFGVTIDKKDVKTRLENGQLVFDLNGKVRLQGDVLIRGGKPEDPSQKLKDVEVSRLSTSLFGGPLMALGRAEVTHPLHQPAPEGGNRDGAPRPGSTSPVPNGDSQHLIIERADDGGILIKPNQEAANKANEKVYVGVSLLNPAKGDKSLIADLRIDTANAKNILIQGTKEKPVAILGLGEFHGNFELNKAGDGQASFKALNDGASYRLAGSPHVVHVGHTGTVVTYRNGQLQADKNLTDVSLKFDNGLIIRFKSSDPANPASLVKPVLENLDKVKVFGRLLDVSTVDLNSVRLEEGKIVMDLTSPLLLSKPISTDGNRNQIQEGVRKVEIHQLALDLQSGGVIGIGRAVLTQEGVVLSRPVALSGEGGAGVGSGSTKESSKMAEKVATKNVQADNLPNGATRVTPDDPSKPAYLNILVFDGGEGGGKPYMAQFNLFSEKAEIKAGENGLTFAQLRIEPGHTLQVEDASRGEFKILAKEAGDVFSVLDGKGEAIGWMKSDSPNAVFGFLGGQLQQNTPDVDEKSRSRGDFTFSALPRALHKEFGDSIKLVDDSRRVPDFLTTEFKDGVRVGGSGMTFYAKEDAVLPITPGKEDHLSIQKGSVFTYFGSESILKSGVYRVERGTVEHWNLQAAGPDVKIFSVHRFEANGAGTTIGREARVLKKEGNEWKQGSVVPLDVTVVKNNGFLGGEYVSKIIKNDGTKYVMYDRTWEPNARNFSPGPLSLRTKGADSGFYYRGLFYRMGLEESKAGVEEKDRKLNGRVELHWADMGRMREGQQVSVWSGGEILTGKVHIETKTKDSVRIVLDPAYVMKSARDKSDAGVKRLDIQIQRVEGNRETVANSRYEVMTDDGKKYVADLSKNGLQFDQKSLEKNGSKFKLDGHDVEITSEKSRQKIETKLENVGAKVIAITNSGFYQGVVVKAPHEFEAEATDGATTPVKFNDLVLASDDGRTRRVTSAIRASNNEKLLVGADTWFSKEKNAEGGASWVFKGGFIKVEKGHPGLKLFGPGKETGEFALPTIDKPPEKPKPGGNAAASDSSAVAPVELKVRREPSGLYLMEGEVFVKGNNSDKGTIMVAPGTFLRDVNMTEDNPRQLMMVETVDAKDHLTSKLTPVLQIDDSKKTGTEYDNPRESLNKMKGRWISSTLLEKGNERSLRFIVVDKNLKQLGTHELDLLQDMKDESFIKTGSDGKRELDLAAIRQAGGVSVKSGTFYTKEVDAGPHGKSRLMYSVETSEGFSVIKKERQTVREYNDKGTIDGKTVRGTWRVVLIDDLSGNVYTDRGGAYFRIEGKSEWLNVTKSHDIAMSSSYTSAEKKYQASAERGGILLGIDAYIQSDGTKRPHGNEMAYYLKRPADAAAYYSLPEHNSSHLTDTLGAYVMMLPAAVEWAGSVLGLTNSDISGDLLGRFSFSVNRYQRQSDEVFQFAKEARNVSPEELLGNDGKLDQFSKKMEARDNWFDSPESFSARLDQFGGWITGAEHINQMESVGDAHYFMAVGIMSLNVMTLGQGGTITNTGRLGLAGGITRWGLGNAINIYARRVALDATVNAAEVGYTKGFGSEEFGDAALYAAWTIVLSEVGVLAPALGKALDQLVKGVGDVASKYTILKTVGKWTGFMGEATTTSARAGQFGLQLVTVGVIGAITGAIVECIRNGEFSFSNLGYGAAKGIIAALILFVTHKVSSKFGSWAEKNQNSYKATWEAVGKGEKELSWLGKARVEAKFGATQTSLEVGRMATHGVGGALTFGAVGGVEQMRVQQTLNLFTIDVVKLTPLMQQGAFVMILVGGALQAMGNWKNTALNLEDPGTTLTLRQGQARGPGLARFGYERLKAGLMMGSWEIAFNSVENDGSFLSFNGWINPMTWVSGLTNLVYSGTDFLGLSDPSKRARGSPDTRGASYFVSKKNSEALWAKFWGTTGNISNLHPFFSFGRVGFNPVSFGPERAAFHLRSAGQSHFAKGLRLFAQEKGSQIANKIKGSGFIALAAVEHTAAVLTPYVLINPIVIKTFEFYETKAVEGAESFGLIDKHTVDPHTGKTTVVVNGEKKETTWWQRAKIQFFSTVGFLNAPIHKSDSRLKQFYREEMQSTGFIGKVLEKIGLDKLNGSKEARENGLKRAIDLIGNTGESKPTFEFIGDNGQRYELNADAVRELRSEANRAILESPEFQLFAHLGRSDSHLTQGQDTYVMAFNFAEGKVKGVDMTKGTATGELSYVRNVESVKEKEQAPADKNKERSDQNSQGPPVETNKPLEASANGEVAPETAPPPLTTSANTAPSANGKQPVKPTATSPERNGTLEKVEVTSDSNGKGALEPLAVHDNGKGELTIRIKVSSDEKQMRLIHSQAVVVSVDGKDVFTGKAGALNGASFKGDRIHIKTLDKEAATRIVLKHQAEESRGVKLSDRDQRALDTSREVLGLKKGEYLAVADRGLVQQGAIAYVANLHKEKDRQEIEDIIKGEFSETDLAGGERIPVYEALKERDGSAKALKEVVSNIKTREGLANFREFLKLLDKDTARALFDRLSPEGNKQLARMMDGLKKEGLDRLGEFLKANPEGGKFLAEVLNKGNGKALAQLFNSLKDTGVENLKGLLQTVENNPTLRRTLLSLMRGLKEIGAQRFAELLNNDQIQGNLVHVMKGLGKDGANFAEVLNGLTPDGGNALIDGLTQMDADGARDFGKVVAGLKDAKGFKVEGLQGFINALGVAKQGEILGYLFNSIDGNANHLATVTTLFKDLSQRGGQQLGAALASAIKGKNSDEAKVLIESIMKSLTNRSIEGLTGFLNSAEEGASRRLGKLFAEDETIRDHVIKIFEKGKEAGQGMAQVLAEVSEAGNKTLAELLKSEKNADVLGDAFKVLSEPSDKEAAKLLGGLLNETKVGNLQTLQKFVEMYAGREAGGDKLGGLLRVLAQKGLDASFLQSLIPGLKGATAGQQAGELLRAALEKDGGEVTAKSAPEIAEAVHAVDGNSKSEGFKLDLLAGLFSKDASTLTEEASGAGKKEILTDVINSLSDSAAKEKAARVAKALGVDIDVDVSISLEGLVAKERGDDNGERNPDLTADDVDHLNPASKSDHDILILLTEGMVPPEKESARPEKTEEASTRPVIYDIYIRYLAMKRLHGEDAAQLFVGLIGVGIDGADLQGLIDGGLKKGEFELGSGAHQLKVKVEIRNNGDMVIDLQNSPIDSTFVREGVRKINGIGNETLVISKDGQTFLESRRSDRVRGVDGTRVERLESGGERKTYFEVTAGKKELRNIANRLGIADSDMLEFIGIVAEAEKGRATIRFEETQSKGKTNFSLAGLESSSDSKRFNDYKNALAGLNKAVSRQSNWEGLKKKHVGTHDESRAYAEKTHQHALLDNKEYVAAMDKALALDVKLAKGLAFVEGRKLTREQKRDVKDLEATKRKLAKEKYGELNRLDAAKKAADDLKPSPSSKNGLMDTEGVEALRKIRSKLLEIAKKEGPTEKGADALAEAHLIRESLEGVSELDERKVKELEARIQNIPAREQREAMENLVKAVKAQVEDVDSKESSEEKLANVGKALKAVAELYDMDLNGPNKERIAVVEKALDTLMDKRSSDSDRSGALQNLFGKDVTSLETLNAGQEKALQMALVQRFFETHNALGDKKAEPSERKNIGNMQYLQFALLLQFSLGRIAGLAAGGGKSPMFVLGFGEFALRHEKNSGVGELIVYGPDEVDKYLRQYQPLARAMGVEFVDGRGLAQEVKNSKRWTNAYDPTVNGNGERWIGKPLMKVVVLDYHSRGFIENSTRADPNGKPAQLLKNVRVQGLDEADALLLSKTSFISSDGRAVATEEVVNHGKMVLNLALDVLGFEKPESTDVKRDWKLFNEKSPDLDNEKGYRKNFESGEITQKDMETGYWFTARSNGEIIVSLKLLAAIMKKGGEKVKGTEVMQALRAIEAVHRGEDRLRFKTEKGEENPRPILISGGKEQRGQIDSSVMFNVVSVLLYNRFAERRNKEAGKEVMKVADENDIRLSEAGSMATFVQVLQTPTVIHRFGATGTPESMAGLAERVIRMKVVNVEPSKIEDYKVRVRQSVEEAYNLPRETVNKAIQLISLRGLTDEGRAKMLAEAIYRSQHETILDENPLTGERVIGAGILAGSTEIVHKKGVVNYLKMEAKDRGGIRAEFIETVEKKSNEAGLTVGDFIEFVVEAAKKNAPEFVEIAEKFKFLDGDAAKTGDEVERIVKGAAEGRYIILANESGLRALSYDATRENNRQISQVDLFLAGFENFTTESWLQAVARVDRGDNRGARRTIVLDEAILDSHISEANRVDIRLKQDGRMAGLFGGTKGGKYDRLLQKHRDGIKLSVQEKLELASQFLSVDNRARSALFFIGEQTSVQLLKQPLQTMIAKEWARGNEKGAKYLEEVYRAALAHSDKSDYGPGVDLQDFRKIAADSFNSAAKSAVQSLALVAGKDGQKRGVSVEIAQEARLRIGDIADAMGRVDKKFEDYERTPKAGQHETSFAQVPESIMGKSPANTVLDVAIILCFDYILPNTALTRDTKAQSRIENHPEFSKQAESRAGPKLSKAEQKARDTARENVSRPLKSSKYSFKNSESDKDLILNSAGQSLAYAFNSIVNLDEDNRKNLDLTVIGASDKQNSTIQGQALFVANFADPAATLALAQDLKALGQTVDQTQAEHILSSADPQRELARTIGAGNKMLDRFVAASDASVARAAERQYIDVALKDGEFKRSWAGFFKALGELFFSPEKKLDKLQKITIGSLLEEGSSKPELLAIVSMLSEISTEQRSVIRKLISTAADFKMNKISIKELVEAAKSSDPEAALRNLIQNKEPGLLFRPMSDGHKKGLFMIGGVLGLAAYLLAGTAAIPLAIVVPIVAALYAAMFLFIAFSYKKDETHRGVWSADKADFQKMSRGEWMKWGGIAVVGAVVLAGICFGFVPLATIQSLAIPVVVVFTFMNARNAGSDAKGKGFKDVMSGALGSLKDQMTSDKPPTLKKQLTSSLLTVGFALGVMANPVLAISLGVLGGAIRYIAPKVGAYYQQKSDRGRWGQWMGRQLARLPMIGSSVGFSPSNDFKAAEVLRQVETKIQDKRDELQGRLEIIFANDDRLKQLTAARESLGQKKSGDAEQTAFLEKLIDDQIKGRKKQLAKEEGTEIKGMTLGQVVDAVHNESTVLPKEKADVLNRALRFRGVTEEKAKELNELFIKGELDPLLDFTLDDINKEENSIETLTLVSSFEDTVPPGEDITPENVSEWAQNDVQEAAVYDYYLGSETSEDDRREIGEKYESYKSFKDAVKATAPSATTPEATPAGRRNRIREMNQLSSSDIRLLAVKEARPALAAAAEKVTEVRRQFEEMLAEAGARQSDIRKFMDVVNQHPTFTPEVQGAFNRLMGRVGSEDNRNKVRNALPYFAGTYYNDNESAIGLAGVQEDGKARSSTDMEFLARVANPALAIGEHAPFSDDKWVKKARYYQAATTLAGSQNIRVAVYPDNSADVFAVGQDKKGRRTEAPMVAMRRSGHKIDVVVPFGAENGPKANITIAWNPATSAEKLTIKSVTADKGILFKVQVRRGESDWEDVPPEGGIRVVVNDLVGVTAFRFVIDPALAGVPKDNVPTGPVLALPSYLVKPASKPAEPTTEAAKAPVAEAPKTSVTTTEPSQNGTAARKASVPLERTQPSLEEVTDLKNRLFNVAEAINIVPEQKFLDVRSYVGVFRQSDAYTSIDRSHSSEADVAIVSDKNGFLAGYYVSDRKGGWLPIPHEDHPELAEHHPRDFANVIYFKIDLSKISPPQTPAADNGKPASNGEAKGGWGKWFGSWFGGSTARSPVVVTLVALGMVILAQEGMAASLFATISEMSWPTVLGGVITVAIAVITILMKLTPNLARAPTAAPRNEPTPTLAEFERTLAQKNYVSTGDGFYLHPAIFEQPYDGTESLLFHALRPQPVLIDGQLSTRYLVEPITDGPQTKLTFYSVEGRPLEVISDPLKEFIGRLPVSNIHPQDKSDRKAVRGISKLMADEKWEVFAQQIAVQPLLTKKDREYILSHPEKFGIDEDTLAGLTTLGRVAEAVQNSKATKVFRDYVYQLAANARAFATRRNVAINRAEISPLTARYGNNLIGHQVNPGRGIPSLSLNDWAAWARWFGASSPLTIFTNEQTPEPNGKITLLYSDGRIRTIDRDRQVSPLKLHNLPPYQSLTVPGEVGWLTRLLQFLKGKSKKSIFAPGELAQARESLELLWKIQFNENGTPRLRPEEATRLWIGLGEYAAERMNKDTLREYLGAEGRDSIGVDELIKQLDRIYGAADGLKALANSNPFIRQMSDRGMMPAAGMVTTHHFGAVAALVRSGFDVKGLMPWAVEAVGTDLRQMLMSPREADARAKELRRELSRSGNRAASMRSSLALASFGATRVKAMPGRGYFTGDWFIDVMSGKNPDPREQERALELVLIGYAAAIVQENESTLRDDLLEELREKLAVLRIRVMESDPFDADYGAGRGALDESKNLIALKINAQVKDIGGEMLRAEGVLLHEALHPLVEAVRGQVLSRQDLTPSPSPAAVEGAINRKAIAMLSSFSLPEAGKMLEAEVAERIAAQQKEGAVVFGRVSDVKDEDWTALQDVSRRNNGLQKLVLLAASDAEAETAQRKAGPLIRIERFNRLEEYKRAGESPLRSYALHNFGIERSWLMLKGDVYEELMKLEPGAVVSSRDLQNIVDLILKSSIEIDRDILRSMGSASSLSTAIQLEIAKVIGRQA